MFEKLNVNKEVYVDELSESLIKLLQTLSAMCVKRKEHFKVQNFGCSQIRKIKSSGRRGNSSNRFTKEERSNFYLCFYINI